MENNPELLQKLEKYSRMQLWFTCALCILCAVMLISMLLLTSAVTGAAQEILTLVAPLQEVAAQINEMSSQVQEMATEAETVMKNLGEVTQSLAGVDLGSMVEGVNSLTAGSQAAVSEAMKKLETIDIDTLNKAIKDLADIVEPLAKVSKIFG